MTDPTTAPPTVEYRDLLMADSVVLIGGNTLLGLRDLQVRATENVAGEVIIIEVLAGQSGASTFKAAIGGTATARTGMELSDGTKFTVTESTAIKATDRTSSSCMIRTKIEAASRPRPTRLMCRKTLQSG